MHSRFFAHLSVNIWPSIAICDPYMAIYGYDIAICNHIITILWQYGYIIAIYGYITLNVAIYGQADIIAHSSYILVMLWQYMAILSV